ncbi:peptidoglycan-binding protein [Mesorhizobium sp. L-8-3]|uniref:peptidoglycan-binding protein n=1 Tax=Mesorhizobium sp. L-8-3 TaxID=2744522 RepID=UPI001927F8F7|nr:peptidoglycan-binding protein [Mesorhizobium sp. L-8-3]BCH27329.1 peptidoglycan-binding protein [Mesorhizobium sp. L-8-3]
MNSKRSYLDSLNAGRPRKAHASLEELNRSLEAIGNRLERGHETPLGRADDFSRPGQWASDARTRSGTDHGSRAEWSRRNDFYQSIAHDIDRVRGQEEGVASVGRIAGELKGLREELRHQMTSGLRREFDMLRSDIERAYAASPAARDGAQLGLEFERLSDVIHSLAERNDDRGVNLLRLELEQVRSAIDSLAREETVRAADRRWEDFDKRWSRVEDRLSVQDRDDDPAIAALNQRLEQIVEAVHNLPESLSLRSLEEKVRILAGAVEHFASQQDRRGHETFVLIEERLDEISRAIVASTATLSAPQFDPAPFERVEARISSLARQVEELIEERPSGEVIDRLDFLSQRVDEIAARGALPEKSMERLTRQVMAIAEKLDGAPAAPDTDDILRGIEDRFVMLSDLLDRRQGDAIEHGQALFRDLERRLEDVVMRLDERNAASAADDRGIMDAIDQRFADLSRRLDQDRQGASEDAMRYMEARLEDISARLESSAAQVAAIDPDLIRNLEAQVAGLSAHLSQPSAPLPDFDDIGPRLDEIEQSIAGNREAILETARQAAENAVRSFAGSPAEAAAVAGLAEDLKSLETLTRRSDERNTRTFEAIHDTLLKIVDRLGTLEQREPEAIEPLERFGKRERQPEELTAVDRPDAQGEPGPAVETPADLLSKLATGAAPSLDRDEEPAASTLAFDTMHPSDAEPQTRRSPAEAAAAAAVAAIGADARARTEPEGRVRSMLGGLTRAFSAKREKPEPVSAEPAMAPTPEAPSLDLDEPLDPKIANRPLEPGSGTPDLNAIMRRVREERGQPARANETEAAKSDFIAAARRAAQAAAAEAGTMKRQADGTGLPKSFGIGEFLRGKRKPILMGAVAVMLALAGLQLGKAFLAGDEQVAQDAPMSAPAASLAPEPSAPVPAVSADTAAPSAVGAGEQSGTIQEDDAIPADDASLEPEIDAPAADSAAHEVETGMPTAAIPHTAEAPAIAEPPAETAPAPEANAAPMQQPAFEPAPVEAGPVALREAADTGDPKAVFEIGARYADGRGIKTDMAAAAKWYERSAELGFAPAQYRIGNFYEKGLGVTRDVAKAKTWYQMAAEQGNASAMHNLAVLFAMGADGVTDNDSAARWFGRAAELGVKDSQFNLGILAAKGVGMQQNLEESYKWFALVAKTGDRDAVTKRDEIANALRPEQLERARAAAELWKPKPVDAEANTLDIPEAWQTTTATTASIDVKKAVASIQMILNKNGYDAGGADGVMGERTKSAIVAFQKDNGLEPTGQVDEKLVETLLEKK